MRILSNPGETPRNPPGSVFSAAGAVAIKSNRPPYRRPTATEILKLMERKGLWLPRGGTVLARLIVGSSMTTGELTSMIIYAVQILSGLMMLSMMFGMVIMARSSAERIVEVLDEQSSLSDPDDPVQEVAGGSIDFEHVSFICIGDKEKLALKDVDIHIKSGETIGLLGGTGCEGVWA